MSSAEQSSEPLRDFGSPATWGDVEQVRLSLGAQIDTQMAEMRTQMAEIPTQMAQLETRLTRWFAGFATATVVAVIGFLVGILQTVD